jgi:hypothetical protein
MQSVMSEKRRMHLRGGNVRRILIAAISWVGGMAAGHAQLAAGPSPDAFVSELFIKLEFSLPKSVVLGPSNLGDILISWTPAGGGPEKSLPPQQLGGDRASWKVEEKAFMLNNAVTDLSISGPSRLRVAILCPIIRNAKELAFVEISSENIPVPGDTSGAFYIDGKAKVREYSNTTWTRPEATPPAVKRARELFYLLYAPSEGVRTSLDYWHVDVDLLSGKGVDLDKFTKLTTVKMEIVRNGSSNPNQFLFFATPPALDNVPGPELRAAMRLEIKKGWNDWEESGSVEPAALLQPRKENNVSTLAGTVAELKGREKWNKR